MAKATLASLFDRFKAGIVDMFMIMMPIQYFITYIVVGSASDYRQNQLVILLASAIYILVITLFLFYKAQSPGYKYAMLHLRSTSGKRASLFQIIFRLVLFIISFSLVVGMIFPFFRKDKQFLHDLLSKTIVIKELR